MIECECGVTLSYAFHSCEKELPIRLEICSDSWELCKIIEHQLAFGDARWKKDGYVVCGECYVKLVSEVDVCSDYFCIQCQGEKIDDGCCEDCGFSSWFVYNHIILNMIWFHFAIKYVTSMDFKVIFDVDIAVTVAEWYIPLYFINFMILLKEK